MARVVAQRIVTAEELEARRRPRHDLVAERAVPAPDGSVAFELADGPFRRWERHLSAPRPAPGGRWEVTEQVEFSLAVPVWTVLFTPALRWSIRRRRPGAEGVPWWAPPGRLDARAATTMGLLGLLALFAGYLGTLLTQTNTFFGEDFGASDADLGWLQGLVRVGALASLALVALADRRGRRRVLVAVSLAGCAATAAGALAPDLAWLGVAQTAARSCSMATAILVAIVAVEELPTRSRAYGLSVLVMAAALGAGQAVLLLPVAGLGEGAWRVLFAVPLLALWPIVAAGRRLPESRRFVAASRPAAGAGGGGGGGAPARQRPALGRLALLGSAAFLLELFTSPAAGFLNEYLRTERSFSAVQLSLFTVLTNTPAGIGIVVGGRLADVRGRRLVGAVGVACGVGLTVAMYLATGWAVWAWSLLAGILGALAIPALGVYGPELFPTSARGRANGIINLCRVGGSALGLVAAGELADRLAGGLPTAMALLAVGPAVVVVLVLVAFPETSAVELEELNPEDAPLARELLELDGLDPDAAPGTWVGRDDHAGGAN